MKTTLIFLFSFILAISLPAQDFEIQKDSLARLSERQCILGAIKLYESSNQEMFFDLADFKIKNSNLKYSYEISRLNLLKANYYYKTNIDSSNYYLKNVDISLDADTSITLQYSFNRTKGMAYLFDGQYVIATEEFIKNVDLCTERNDDKKLSMTYSDIAIPNYYMENYTEAIKFWELSANISGGLEDYKTVYDTYLNIALAYAQSGDIVSAKSYKAICIELTKNKDIEYDKTSFYMNMGVIDYNLKDFNSAIQLFTSASQFAIANDDLNSYARSISNISACYIEQKLPEKGVDFLNEALYNTNGTLEPKFKSSLYKMLGEAYSGIKSYDKAYTYLDSAYELKQELLNESRSQQLTEMQEKYHSVQKDKKIAETELAYRLEKSQKEQEKSEKEQEQLKSSIQTRQKNYLFIGLGLLTLFAVFMYNRFRVTRKQKGIIEIQQEKTERQKQQIQFQHLELEESHKEISDSIKYAERLQLAILPSQENLKTNLGDGFVYFQPKDIVSGDFYWSIKIHNRVYFAAADCTGHGVPGAMVSVVCSNALNRSVKEFALKSPARILDKTRELVIETFARSGQDVKDGMDISICSLIDNKLEYAGANNPLWIIRDTRLISEEKLAERTTQSSGDKSLIEIKANRQPIGLYEEISPFTNHQLELFPGDKIYLSTDGYADQFGGADGKKLKYKPFKLFLLEIANLPMEEQKNKLEQHFKLWKGNFDQIDDVCIIGVHLK